MARRPPDPKVAKARRQRKIAIGGSLALVLLLAVQVPKTLKMLHPKTTAAPPVAVSAPTATTTSPAPPAASGGGTTTPVASSGTGLADTESAPAADQGQLISFERFAAKDPFAQQVSLSGAPADSSGGTTDLGTIPAHPGAASGGAGTSAGSGDAGGTGTTTGTGGDAGFTTGTGATTTAAPAATATTISVNGEAEAVATGADFPATGPLFTLTKLGKGGKSVEIGVAGGKLATGGATVTLTRGKPLTLMNTADGTRYTLVLLTVEGF